MQMIKCFPIIWNYSNNLCYYKTMTNWVVLKVEKKRKSEGFQFQINYYSNYNYYLDNIVYAAYLSNSHHIQNWKYFQKSVLLFWKRFLEKVSNTITDLITPLFKERTYGIGLILCPLGRLWNDKQLERYRIFWSQFKPLSASNTCKFVYSYSLC